MKQRDAVCAALVVLAIGAVVGCGGADDPGESGSLEVRVDTVAGVVRIESRGEPPLWRLVTVLELGEAGGFGSAGPQEFGRVHGIALGRDGSVYVADGIAREIRRFDEDGNHLSTFGAPGEGPGEFQGLQSLGWIGPDTLAALDSPQGRVVLFSPEGELLGQWRYPAGMTGPPSVLRFHPTGERELYALGLEEEGPRAGQRAFLRFTGDGRSGGLPWPEMDLNPQATVVCEWGEGMLSFFANAYTSNEAVYPAPDGLLLRANTGRYALARLTTTGDTVGVILRAHPELPVSRAEWEERMEGYVDFRSERPGARCDPDPSPPTSKPPLLGAHHDKWGRLWVEVRTPAGEEFHLHDPEGRLLARMEAPERIAGMPIIVGDDRIALFAEGEMDEPLVRVYRIESEPDR